jgi:hypothetical protein
LFLFDEKTKGRRRREGGWWDCEEEKNPRKGTFVIRDDDPCSKIMGPITLYFLFFIFGGMEFG